MDTVLRTLEGVRGFFVEDPSRWTNQYYALNAKGYPVCALCEGAVRWSAVGAMIYLTGREDGGAVLPWAERLGIRIDQLTARVDASFETLIAVLDGMIARRRLEMGVSFDE